MDCQKHFTKLQKMKNIQSEIKPIKIRKRVGTTYCFRCKDFTHNFRPQKVKMTNKVLRQKSHCVACQSNNSKFLKQKRNNNENIHPKMFRTKNNELIMQSKSPVCGIKKSRFVKEQKAKGLLSNLRIKTLLSKILLLNILF